MKRAIIMTMAITLSVVCVNAQVKTGSEIIDGLVSGWLDADTKSELEEMFASYGVKASVNNRIDTNNKFLIAEYVLFDKEVFEHIDIEGSKIGAVDGMFRETQRKDPSGDMLRLLVSELNRTGWKLKIIAKYNNLRKEAIATSKDFNKMAAQYE